MKQEHKPEYAFGIKHSPYLGQLKGDEWVHARTEVVTPPIRTGVATKNASNTSVSQNVTNGVTNGHTTTTTRTHSDGTRIRTETFSYTKGPTIKTTTTTTQQISAC